MYTTCTATTHNHHSAELRVKCRFACTNHVCRDVRIHRHPNVTSHDGYILGALAVFGNATDAVYERLTQEGSTIDQLGQITCDLGYGSTESDW